MKRSINTYTLLLLFLASATLLSACKSNPTHKPSLNARLAIPPNESIDGYLAHATVTPEPEKQAYQIKAISHLLEDDMNERAQQVVTEINSNTLPAPLRNESLLLKGELALNKQQPKEALTLLSGLEEMDSLPVDQQMKYHQLLASAYEQTHHPIQSTNHYLQLLRYPANEITQAAYQEKIWYNISQLDLENLQALRTQPQSNELNGWIELAYIAKRYPGKWQQMQQSLIQWTKTYPKHPGRHMIKENIESTTLIPPIKQIALLLPLRGELAVPAQAVADGFMVAYYQNQPANPNKSSMKIYDTSQEKSITKIYQQAIEDGADFIVGPLDKLQTQAIAKPRIISVPTLALNYTSKLKKIDDFYQFGLSPIDEAMQISQKAWQEGHRKAIIIMPASEWGQEIGQTFMHNWQQRGGKIVGELAYADSENYHSAIKRLLNLDRSENREKQLQKIIHQEVKVIPRRRDDADFIFLIAFPSTARQIYPLLKYYYAGKLPIYAPSIIYSGIPDPVNDRDLNGIIFSEIPWLLSQIDDASHDTTTRYSHFNPDEASYYTRLQALGYDAFMLTREMNQLVLFPHLFMQGQTGALYLNDQNQINRQLQWVQFKDGIPHAI